MSLPPNAHRIFPLIVPNKECPGVPLTFLIRQFLMKSLMMYAKVVLFYLTLKGGRKKIQLWEMFPKRGPILKVDLFLYFYVNNIKNVQDKHLMSCSQL